MKPSSANIKPDIMPNAGDVSEVIRNIANEEILSRFKKLKKAEISNKYSGEIVTEADIQAEARLAESLKQILHGSQIVGEEEYANNNEILKRFDDASPVWILDPLDGTRNFSEGSERFCVIVAYCVQKIVYMGWIYSPIEDQMFFALKGSGAWCNDSRLPASESFMLSEMIGSVGKRRREQIRKHYSQISKIDLGTFTRYRCLGLEYADLARGKLHFAEYHLLKPWDHAAGILLTAEAGGFAAYADSMQLYMPGPISREKLVVTHRRDIWEHITSFLSV